MANLVPSPLCGSARSRIRQLTYVVICRAGTVDKELVFQSGILNQPGKHRLRSGRTADISEAHETNTEHSGVSLAPLSALSLLVVSNLRDLDVDLTHGALYLHDISDSFVHQRFTEWRLKAQFAAAWLRLIGTYEYVTTGFTILVAQFDHCTKADHITAHLARLDDDSRLQALGEKSNSPVDLSKTLLAVNILGVFRPVALGCSFSNLLHDSRSLNAHQLIEFDREFLGAFGCEVVRHDSGESSNCGGTAQAGQRASTLPAATCYIANRRSLVGNSSSETAKAVRVALALIALGCFVLGATATGAYLAISHIVRTAVVDYAKVLGIELKPAEVRFGPGFVQISAAQFRALEVPGVTGSIRRIDVDLSGLSPGKIALTEVKVSAAGDPIDLADGLLRYSSKLLSVRAQAEGKLSLPELHWQHLSVDVSTANSLMPTASATEVTVVTNAGPTHDEFLIRTATTKIADFDLGPLELAVRNQNGNFELGWGPSLHESKWHVAYRKLESAEELKFSFQPCSLLDVLGRFGATTGLDAFVKTKMQGHLNALRDRASGKTTGSLALDLVGFTPPFPPELKGYRFSDTSTARTNFELDPLGLEMQLRDLELKTGDIRLFGHGRVDRDGVSLRVRAELTTLLDCVTLAKGWMAEQVSGELGSWAQRNVPKAVNGSVNVKVQLDADTSHLEQAKIVKRIGIGCGLRPMSISDWLNLGLPPLPDAATLERLRKQLPAPSTLPGLPTLPQLLPPLVDLTPKIPRPTRPKSNSTKHDGSAAPAGR